MADLSIDPLVGQDGTVIITPMDIKEIILTFSETVAADTAINVQDGTYSGGGPAGVEGNADIVFPPTGAEFKTDTRIHATLNGQELSRGNATANDEFNWASTTQFSLAVPLQAENTIIIRQFG